MNVRGLELDGGWTAEEVRELHRILAPLPESFVEDNQNLQTIIRRPVLQDAPPNAPGHSKYEPDQAAIVVFDKGVYHDGQIDPEQFRRSVYHELAHSILKGRPELLEEWKVRTRGDGFVDDYAKTSPEEDFCDTFSEYFIDRRTRNAVPRKAEFMRDMITNLKTEDLFR